VDCCAQQLISEQSYFSRGLFIDKARITFAMRASFNLYGRLLPQNGRQYHRRGFLQYTHRWTGR